MRDEQKPTPQDVCGEATANKAAQLALGSQRRQRERQKSNRFDMQNNDFARASCFSVHFFVAATRLRHKNTFCHFLWRT